MIPENDPQLNIHEIYKEIRKWKRECIALGMSEEEFVELYNTSRKELRQPQSTRPVPSGTTRRIKYYIALIAFYAVLFVFHAIFNYKAIYSCIACNIQDYIYPGLRFLRNLVIPIISLFPSLTALYQETCLVNNPFFAVADMDCWPCSTVNNIMEVYKPEPVREQHNPPFVFKTEQEIITPAKLKQFYMMNENVFDEELPRILTDMKLLTHPIDMFHEQESGDKHTYIWEFYNMNLAKALRQIIPRPAIVPKFGQSTERYIIMDSSQKQFQIPDTECNFSFLLSLSESRTIELRPAEECKLQCKTLKVDLKQTYLLWYNWWYWRPFVQPSTGNGTFIAHVGSYC